MVRSRLPTLLVSLLAAACACSAERGPIDRDLVCEVTGTRFAAPALDNESAWDWPGEVRHAIDAHRWIEAGKEEVDSCGGAMTRVDRVAFSEDRSLAQITLNYFPRPGEPGFGAGEIGSISTCLLRRDTSPFDHWSLVACKLDAAS